jgi:competence protein ComEC
MARAAGDNRLPDPNDSSIVVRAELGTVCFLFPGDAMAAAERDMVARSCDRLAATVLAAPHHGSRTSSTPGFLDCVSPEVVVVSSGWSRRRYFPHPTVEKRYRERNLAVLCTHRCGAVTVVTDGSGYRVQTMVAPEEEK